ncbi:hypothetical protein VPH35_086561 [Triticum aestivum]
MLGPSAAPKRPRHADGGGGDAGDDRLSALPDDLLCVILSRLKALQTVRTCVLSMRWRHLWRAVPRLDIDIDEPEFYSYYKLNNFTTNLLRSHDFTLLEGFRLHGGNNAVEDRWLRRDIGRDAWPCRLSSLHLSRLQVELDDLASHVSSILPAREDIVSSSLKKLVVDGQYTAYDGEIFALIIEAPALVSLRLGKELDHIVDPDEPHNMPSLVDASIHLYWIRNEEEERHQLGILGALSNVTTLHLLHFAVTLLLYEIHGYLPVFKFENPRTLFLDECLISDDFLGLRQYLHNSPNLEKLTLRHCKVPDFHRTKEVMERHQSYSKHLVHFECKNLRLSEIIYRDGDAYVHLLVKLFVGMWRNLPSNKIELTPRN